MKRLSSLLLFVFLVLTTNPAFAVANSGDFSGGVAIGAGYAGANTAPTNGLIVQGNTGLGNTSPDALLSLTGQSAQTIDMVRETTASTAGNNLTLQAGGAVSGGTNLGGGSLILSSGLATGNNTSNVQVQTYPAGSSGTTDNSALTALTISAAGITGSNAATTVQANAGSGTNKNGGTLTLASGVSTGTGTSSMNFQVYGAGSSGSTANPPTTVMTITSFGAVGIGTTTPITELDLYGASPASDSIVARVHNATASGYTALELQGSNHDYDFNVGGGSVTDIPGAFGVYDNTNAAYRFVIASNGDIGIGTTSPAANLQVIGGFSASANCHPLWQNSSINIDYCSGSGGGRIQVLDSGGNATTLLLDPSGGTVGIGTTSPRGGSLLDVNGKLYVATFAASSSTTVCQNGNVLASCTSALRFKSNIHQTNLGLKQVLQMNPVTFDFKDHKENWEKHDFGFVAEEMEKINPLFVTYDDQGKPLGVRYMQLTAVEARAIQELNANNAKLESQIAELRRAIDQLKQQRNQ